jgi:regulation of enolase protein 1 (concanavalin A-like superfamily)
MDLSETSFVAHNISSDFEQPENISEYFTLTAPADTTLWRKPSSGDQVSAPMILTRLRQPFILAEVTVTAEMEVEWDQAGLVIFVGMTPSDPLLAQPPRSRRRQQQSQYQHQNHGYDAQQSQGKWLKVGLGLADEDVGVATAVAQPNCGPDWSFTPVFPDVDPDQPHLFRRSSLRVKLEKVGQDLWVWYCVPDSHTTAGGGYRSPNEVSRGWKKARELSEFFMGAQIKDGIWVGCYASRPLELDDGDGKSELFVEFEDLEIL